MDINDEHSDMIDHDSAIHKNWSAAAKQSLQDA